MSRAALRTPAIVAATLLLLSAASVQAFGDSGGEGEGHPCLVFATGEGASSTGDAVSFNPVFDGLLPGRSVTSDLLVYNTGDVSARLGLTAPVIMSGMRMTGARLEDAITLTIVQGESSTVLYRGPLTEASFSGLRVSAEDPDGVPIEITATLDDDASQDLSGQRIDIMLTFSVEQI